MLTGISGLPGAGKTLMTLDMIQKEYPDRPVYYIGIGGVVGRENFHYLEDPKKWMDCPDGSLIIIDEAHKYFPARRAGSMVPEYVEAFAEHRHHGLDIFLMTQALSEIDHSVRKRMGRHIHLVRSSANAQSATVFTWMKYQKDTDGYHEKQEADTKTYKYNKKLYGTYSSAVEHNNKIKIPGTVLKMGALVLIAGSGLVYAFDRITDKGTLMMSDEKPSTEFNEPIEYKKQNSTSNIINKNNYIQMRIPAVKGMPWTAPIYAEQQAQEKMPVPQCVANAKKCYCYTQQATRMNVTDKICRDIVENGYYVSTKVNRNG